jgi:preprotein translocase subunit SecB
MNRYTLYEGRYPVTPTRVYLGHVHFSPPVADEGQRPPDAAAFYIDLEIARPSPLELSVALTVTTSDEYPIHFTATYVADFRMAEAVEEDQQEDWWINTAYGLAPNLLYPYIREMFVNLTARSSWGSVTLPFMPIPLDVPDEDKVIPPPPAGSDYQQELAILEPVVQGRKTTRAATARKGAKQGGGTRARKPRP